MCNKKVDQTRSLLKLKDENWYCFNCITDYIEIRELLRPNGYWSSFFHKKPKYNIPKKRGKYVKNSKKTR